MFDLTFLGMRQSLMHGEGCGQRRGVEIREGFRTGQALHPPSAMTKRCYLRTYLIPSTLIQNDSLFTGQYIW